jgi:tetratricopeptide (TPR) repeat protein
VISRQTDWLGTVLVSIGILSLASSPAPAQEVKKAAAPAPDDEATKALRRGKELAASGDFEKSLEKLDEAVKLKPTLAAARIARAFVENALKKYDAANADAAEALKLDPKNPDFKLTGVWYGTYIYPGGTPSVRFRLILVQDGTKISANVREPKTFSGDPNAPQEVPYVYAICDGQFDPAEKQLRFTKTYDGTAGVSHSIEYTGTLSDDGTKVEGDWSIGGAGGGTFRLQKAAADQRVDPESAN